MTVRGQSSPPIAPKIMDDNDVAAEDAGTDKAPTKPLNPMPNQWIEGDDAKSLSSRRRNHAEATTRTAITTVSAVVRLCWCNGRAANRLPPQILTQTQPIARYDALDRSDMRVVDSRLIPATLTRTALLRLSQTHDQRTSPPPRRGSSELAYFWPTRKTMRSLEAPGSDHFRRAM
uniref:Uncharacterized protein n=1 Tax=Plectus sambesii TaxID=2011161 RepID=A0A914X1J4_9BILA